MIRISGSAAHVYKHPMTPLRRAGKAMFAVLAVFLVIDFTAWRWVTSRILTNYADWRGQAEAAGLRVETASPIRAGWPFAAQILLPDVRAITAAGMGRAEWVRLGLSPLHPNTLAIDFEGRQGLQIGERQPVDWVARRLAATVSLDGMQPVRGQAVDLRADFPGGPALVASASVRLEPNSLVASASAIALPGLDLPFGAIAHATAVMRFEALPEAAAGLWTIQDHRLVVDAATLEWGPLQAEGHMTIALDTAMQPSGQAVLHVAGFREAIDALVKAGLVEDRSGRVAATVLGLMAVASPNGPATAELPFTLTGGILAMGAIPLLHVPLVTLP